MEVLTARKIFMLAKKSENISKRTLELYDDTLKRFSVCLSSENVLMVEEITATNVREYLLKLQEAGLRGITQHKHFRILRTFARFLHQEDIIQKRFTDNVKPPRREQKPMRTYTKVEINKILGSFNRDTFTGLRDYTMMLTLFSSGVRLGELLNLQLSDVNITTDLIQIRHGKGDKTRFVPIARTLRRNLKAYFIRRDEVLGGELCPWLFISTRKDSRKFTDSGINCIFRRLKKSFNFEGEKFSSHTWRHTFAKTYLLNGGDLISLQKLLGHADITTTRGYLNLNDAEIKQQHALFNPLDNSNWAQ